MFSCVDSTNMFFLNEARLNMGVKRVQSWVGVWVGAV